MNPFNKQTMKAFKKTTNLIGCLALTAVLSCEIEDDYPHQKLSEQLGRKLAATDGFSFGIYWSSANEVITLGQYGVRAINAESGLERNVPFDGSQISTIAHSSGDGTSSYNVSTNTWLIENMLYFIQLGNLSVVDLTTMTYQYVLLDSVHLQQNSSPFNASHIAYGKYRPNDYGDPSIFLYNLKSGHETYVTSGHPCVFSPDGTQLLLTKEGQYHSYDLSSKNITPLNLDRSYTGELVKWTPQGIISFENGSIMNGSGIIVTNKTNRMKIGEWPSIDQPNVSWISSSGNHMNVTKYKCTNGNLNGDCPYQTKIVYSIVDILNKEETELAETTTYYIPLIAMSPDQRKLALIGRDSNIYIAEK
jgi:hypothetical protein